MPRGSGIPPTNDQDRQKEIQMIKDYKILVEEVYQEVLIVPVSRRYAPKLDRYEKNTSHAKPLNLPPNSSSKTPNITPSGTTGASSFVNSSTKLESLPILEQMTKKCLMMMWPYS